ncbi:hypothetical protein [Paraliobacillus ryukyuensis]|uniref:hypothetical protein n=1 Tax=Paraliobacillus ryukyuensis TaxID=200904 RepID=UPI0009A7761C|nr:hypothetical protein [Paraliobacillus ryukyuensis]
MYSYEINKLINSDIEAIKRIGEFLYDKQLEEGMSAAEVGLLLDELLDGAISISQDLNEVYNEG